MSQNTEVKNTKVITPKSLDRPSSEQGTESALRKKEGELMIATVNSSQKVQNYIPKVVIEGGISVKDGSIDENNISEHVMNSKNQIFYHRNAFKSNDEAKDSNQKRQKDLNGNEHCEGNIKKENDNKSSKLQSIESGHRNS